MKWYIFFATPFCVYMQQRTAYIIYQICIFYNVATHYEAGGISMSSQFIHRIFPAAPILSPIIIIITIIISIMVIIIIIILIIVM